MKLSQGHWQTYKDDPKDAEIPSHKLMLRAGLIHKSASGLYTMLPFGKRIQHKIEAIVRQEHDRKGTLEIDMPVVTPGELWMESGRLQTFGPQMLKAIDRSESTVCISPTNEEAVVDVFRKNIKSYKQLPVTYYQIKTKFRDEIRPRFGLMRAREFLMKDAYSFHESWEDLNSGYELMYGIYQSIFNRIGLEYTIVEADAGAMADGNQKTHEFQVLAENGEDRLLNCKECGYGSNIEKAVGKRTDEHGFKEGTLKDISTPNLKTITDVAKLLNTAEANCLKALVYRFSKEEQIQFCLAFLLGDDEINEIKLTNYLGADADSLAKATDGELEGLGLISGFIGPMNVDSSLEVVFDQSIYPDRYYITGANKVDYHTEGVCLNELGGEIKRAELRLARQSDACPNCANGVLRELKGIEVGHVFQLGDKYTKALKAQILDSQGKALFPLMGCYGIGITRIMGAAIEQGHDEKGIIWPVSIAPFHVHFIVISKSEETKKLADDYYQQLQEAGLEVVMDDRKVGPGFKFKDADLLGVPVHIVLGERDYQKDGLVEFRLRKDEVGKRVSLQEAIQLAREFCLGQ